MKTMFNRAERLTVAARLWQRDGDDARKREFKNAARDYLKHLALDLGLPAGSYDIRWNAGGPAVSGDATLHHERLYVHVSATFGHGPIDNARPWFYARSCKGRRDYTGGDNRWCDAVSALSICQSILTNDNR